MAKMKSNGAKKKAVAKKSSSPAAMAKKSVKKPAAKMAKMAKKPVKKMKAPVKAMKGMKKSPTKPTKKTAKKPAKKTIKKPVTKSARKPIKKPAPATGFARIVETVKEFFAPPPPHPAPSPFESGQIVVETVEIVAVPDTEPMDSSPAEEDLESGEGGPH